MFEQIKDFIFNFMPLTFFGFSVPLIPLAFALFIIIKIVGGTIKIAINVSLIAGAIYLVSRILETFK